MLSSGATTVLFFIAISNTNLLILAPEEPCEAGEGAFPFFGRFCPESFMHSSSVNMWCGVSLSITSLKNPSEQVHFTKDECTLVHLELVDLYQPVTHHILNMQHTYSYQSRFNRILELQHVSLTVLPETCLSEVCYDIQNDYSLFFLTLMTGDHS